ncbi:MULTISPECIES: hypothetical protein [unclassified Streptomyces]|uniref:hypothetical protein n=1 Tax=unclassified Streptomyces TaxID=2593676 RepID=UPI000978D9E6|nr:MULTISPECIES: hypothetical protein [unclassified Streptomyces]ONI48654.1 hypothetical protein STIB_72080 [Streptomyces sp. IB2014 011-1]RDV48187.1 hypothetical protein DDV98_28885 [Streptomyces sp. IB2014 011-12]
MTTPETEARPETTAPDLLCGWEDCQETATTALTFRGQPGHVHNCNPHAAINREWSDVTSSAPMPPCTYPHDGTTYVAMPADL